MKMQTGLKIRLGLDIGKSLVLDMGALPLNPGRVADIGETSTNQERIFIQVVEEPSKDFICDQDMRGWPGHGDDFTRFMFDVGRGSRLLSGFTDAGAYQVHRTS